MKLLSFFFFALILASGSAIFFAGCASTQEISLRENLPMDDIIREVNAHAKAISTLHGEGTISVETPSFANSASFDITVKRQPDSVRVIVEGPFGIHLASLLFTSDHYTFYNSIKNEVMEGALSADSFSASGNFQPSFMNLLIDPKEMLNTLCETRMLDTDETPDSFYTSDGNYVFEFRRSPYRVRYTVDGANLVVAKIEHIDSSGTLEMEERYSYNKRKDGVMAPKAILLRHSGIGSAVSVSYESVVLNAGSEPLALSIPSDARRIVRGSQSFGQ